MNKYICVYIYIYIYIYKFKEKKEVKVKVAQSCPTLQPHRLYTVHGILQDRKLEWVTVLFSS